MNEQDPTAGVPDGTTEPTPAVEPSTPAEPQAVSPIVGAEPDAASPSPIVAPPAEATPARAAQPSAGPAGAPEAMFEPAAVAATPTAPVSVAAQRRPSRGRWAIAGLIALVVVALSAAGLFALVGASNQAVVAAWSPSDAVAYVEVRGDLPGDQRQNLGAFLAHFPGFADQSTLQTKLDETLDKLVSKASDGKQDWSKDIKPWFGGQVGVSFSSFPTMSMTDPGTGMANFRYLLVATQKDPAAAMAWVKSLSGTATTEETYKGVTLTIYSSTGMKAAVGATGGVLLAGDEASVKAAIDRNGKDGLASSKSFSSAMASIKDDQVTRSYIDMKAYFDALTSMSGMMGGTATLPQSMLDRLPAWVGAGGRIDSDALVGTLVAPVPSGTPTVDDRESAIAKRLPAQTIALFDAHDYGTLLKAQLDQLRNDPQLGAALKQADQAAATLGGLDHLIGWIGDVGVVVTADGATPGGGIVIIPTDVDQATGVMTELRNLIALGGASSGITITDEPYGDGTITTIDAGDLGALIGKLNPSSSTPTLPISGHVQVSYTIQNGALIVGIGPDWVKSIVDVKPGSSLADEARYKDAMNRVGAKNATSVWVDLTAIRTLVEPLIAKNGGANYATDVKPYVEPFDVLAGATQTDDGKSIATYVVTVIKPAQ